MYYKNLIEMQRISDILSGLERGQIQRISGGNLNHDSYIYRLRIGQTRPIDLAIEHYPDFRSKKHFPDGD